MDRIKTVSFVGMGCLGMLYGGIMSENIGSENVSFIMDEERYLRHEKDRYIVNGEEKHYQMRTGDEVKPVDLLVFSVKFNALSEAIELARPAVSENTIIVSLLNGISSEKVLEEHFDREQIVDSLCVGMDSVRDGVQLSYTKIGHWEIGAHNEKQEENVRLVKELCDRAGVPCEVKEDIRHAIWNKFMINVGINQTCMVHNKTYGVAAESGEAYDDLVAAMREVILVAPYEGVELTEEELERNIALLADLDKDKYPSMQQDALAKRKSEVELFAGTMIKLAEKHGLDVPVNRRYYEAIKKMEAEYGQKD
ncbi:MAG: ketopantoate reductase family protein [Mogibacterium sp.]|nr:ketopantoate reductase family protein [Mogibacterium sp.]